MAKLKTLAVIVLAIALSGAPIGFSVVASGGLALVDRLYPESDVPDAVARETSAHDAYSAAQLRGTVRRPAVEAQLDAWAGSVIGATGPSRAGAGACNGRAHR